MAPLTIIDYVIIHELAHLVHHNHSRNFWNQVKMMYPDFKAAKQWLQENSYLLQI